MDHTSHSAIFNASRLSITVIGAGGIGAATCLALAKMGVPFFTIIDDDVVSDVNMPTQLHRLADLGRPKAEAVSDMISEFSDDIQSILCIEERVDANAIPLTDQIIISCVDSIQARQDIWKAVQGGRNQLYLEARMGAEVFQLHCVDPKDNVWYDRYVTSQSDAEIADVPCTSKATIYTAFLAAAMIADAVKKFITGQALAHKIVLNLTNNSLMEM